MNVVPLKLERRCARLSHRTLTLSLIAGLALTGLSAVGVANNGTSSQASRTVAVEYYPSGSIMSQTEELITADGQIVLDGTTMAWYDENGQLALQRAFKNGEPIGTYASWYANGQQELRYAFGNGQPTGGFTHWYDNGQIESQGSLQDGEYHGHWVAQHADGNVSAAGQFNAGHEVGDWLYVLPDGEIMTTTYDAP